MVRVYTGSTAGTHGDKQLLSRIKLADNRAHKLQQNIKLHKQFDTDKIIILLYHYYHVHFIIKSVKSMLIEPFNQLSSLDFAPDIMAHSYQYSINY